MPLYKYISNRFLTWLENLTAVFPGGVRHHQRRRFFFEFGFNDFGNDRGMISEIIDDVFDTGRTLAFARRHLLTKGAREVVTVALARKPWAPEGEDNVDFHAFDAPGRFLVGYGMDDAGKYRGLPYIGALD